MSSEILGGAENVLKGNLGGAWDIKHGYADAYTDLGIARRFGGAAAAYSLRDIGAINGEVVRVRRVPFDTTTSIDDEANFSANQVSSGALEDWVNGKLEDTLPADVAPAAAAYSLRKVSEGKLVYTGDFSSDADTIGANTTGITVAGNIDGISDGSTSKDNVLKVENDERGVPQLGTTNSDYESSTSGVVEFEYFVPSTHPIVGNFWHIGTNTTSDGKEIAYSARGVKIVGGAWTTAKLFYGSLYGGVDKGTTSGTGGRRLITILDQEVADGVASSTTVSGEDGDVYYISSLTIKTYDAVAVQIRRSSDNAEVKVHFDSNGVISNSSRVTSAAEATIPFTQIDNNDTTLAEFLNPSGSGTDAFVVFWFDQAGTNLQIQIAAASQPQIASSGALLADGIQFDGSDDSLSTVVNFVFSDTDDLSVSSVLKSDTVSSVGTLLSQNGTGGKILITLRTNSTITSYLGGGGGVTLVPYSADEELLLTAIYDDSANTLDGFKNSFNENANTSVTSTACTGTLNIGVSRSSNEYLDGTVKELIIYKSDQTDNRFKIESNINNHYGLYDDANEVTGAFTASGENSFTANGTDGFTIETATADAFAGIELKRKVSDNDIIYVSFNADLSVSGTASPTVALRKESISGTVSSDAPSSGQPSVKKGFNNIAFVSSDDDAKFITFLEDANNVSYTISDFRVSRIQRIGLVQTWYDQSNNGNNATQSVADRQPPIVLNGGLCKMNNGNGAVMGVRDGTLFSGTQLEIDSAVTEPTTTFCTYYNQRSFIFLTAGTLTGSAPSIDLNTNGIEPRFTTADNMGNTTGLDNTIDGQLTVFSAVNGGTAVLRKDGLQLDTLTRTEAEVQGIGFIFRMQSNSGFSGIFVDALIIYDADKTSDFEEIEGELQRANNIVGV